MSPSLAISPGIMVIGPAPSHLTAPLTSMPRGVNKSPKDDTYHGDYLIEPSPYVIVDLGQYPHGCKSGGQPHELALQINIRISRLAYGFIIAGAEDHHRAEGH